MSTKHPSNTFKLTHSKSGDGSFFHSFAEDIPKEKEPAFAVRLGTNILKNAFITYLINKEIRNEVFSTTKNALHMSLLKMKENFKIIVNMEVARAVIKKFCPSEYIVLDRNHLKKVLWSVYTELYEIRDNIEADFFFQEEMEQFDDILLFRKNLKLIEDEEFQLQENSVYPKYASNMPNACTQPSLFSRPLIVPDGKLVSTHDISPEYKYPQKISKFCICTSNETKKLKVKTVDGKQAWKSQHRESSVSQVEQSVDTLMDFTLKPLIVPGTSGESRKLPGRKYPRTGDKISICKPTTMEVDTDSLNETKKQEVETIEYKQTGKSQLGGSSVSQSMPNADTQSHLISKAISLPDTSGESRKLPGRKYPRTSDKISICKPTTKEGDADTLNETTKQGVETVEDKEAAKSQLGGSTVSQSMQNADTHPHLIPISVRDKSGESRTQPGRKYPLTIDKLSSCKPTTMAVDNDSLNEAKKQEVETVEGKQAGKSQLGGSSVSQSMPNGDTQPHSIPKPISVPDTSGESRKQPDRKYPKTSDKISICKPTTKEVDADTLNETTKQEVETVEDKEAGKSQLGGSTVSQSMQNADIHPHLIPISVRDKSGESRTQTGRKYPLTIDKLPSCKPTTMAVDNDSLNEAKKQEVETVEGKQAGKSQLGGSSVSQSMPNGDTQPHSIPKPISVPDTSGESRKQPDRKYPKTSDKISICKPTTKEGDADTLNETTKQGVETVEDKEAGKSQLGGSTVSQSMQNADTHPHLIPIFVRDKSGESRTQPGRKYPLTIDKLSSCKPTTMAVDNDSLNEAKKQEVETVEGKQAGKFQLGGSSVSQSMPNGDTQPYSIPKPISVPDTSGESRKQPDRKYPKTSDKLSSCKPTTMKVDTDSLNETKKQEVETFEGKQAGKLQLGVSAVAQNMPSTDTQLTSIPKPISVPGTSHESRKQPGKKYPQTSDLFSSCKQTTLEVHGYSTEYDSTSEKELFLSESRVLLPLHVYSNNAKSHEELLIPARNDEDIPINLPENGDEFDESPEMSDDEIDSQHLLGFYDPQGHDIELTPLCRHSQPGGYMSYASKFLHIDGFCSSDDD